MEASAMRAEASIDTVKTVDVSRVGHTANGSPGRVVSVPSVVRYAIL